MCTIIEKLAFPIRPKRPIRTCLFNPRLPFSKLLCYSFSRISFNVFRAVHFEAHKLTSGPNTSDRIVSQKVTSVPEQKLKDIVSEKERIVANKLRTEIIALTIGDGNTSHLTYIPSDFHRIFKVYWVKNMPKGSAMMKKLNSRYFLGQNAQIRSEELQIFVHELVRFKYINISQKISSFLLKSIVNNTSFRINSLGIYNDLIDFFSSSGRDKVVNTVFNKMKVLNVKPSAMTYNILGKNYLATTDLNVERLQIWKSIIFQMNAMSIKPDFVSWYITLALLKPGSVIKSSFENVMIKANLTYCPKFNDIKLVDMIDTNATTEQIIEYYNRQQRTFLDVNCMNTVIFQLLRKDSFHRAWNFMCSEASHKSISIYPSCSTVSVFVKYFRVSGNLEQIIRLLNTFRCKYGLVNYNCHRTVLAYLLKFPDGSLPFWYPLIVKYFLRYDITYGLGRHRYLKSLVSNFELKLEQNFPYTSQKNSSNLLCSIKLKGSTKFEDMFFANMRRLFVKDKSLEGGAKKNSLFKGNQRKFSDSSNNIFHEGELDFSPDYNIGKHEDWIESIISKSRSQITK